MCAINFYLLQISLRERSREECKAYIALLQQATTKARESRGERRSVDCAVKLVLSIRIVTATLADVNIDIIQIYYTSTMKAAFEAACFYFFVRS